MGVIYNESWSDLLDLIDVWGRRRRETQKVATAEELEQFTRGL
jgi:hypothetical protein